MCSSDLNHMLCPWGQIRFIEKVGIWCECLKKHQAYQADKNTFNNAENTTGQPVDPSEQRYFQNGFDEFGKKPENNDSGKEDENIGQYADCHLTCKI